MKRRVITPGEGPRESGRRRLRLVDPFAMALWSVIFLAAAVLAFISALRGFSEHWYGDVLTLLDWIIGILALINLFAALSVGIRVSDGVADLGRDAKGNRTTFDVTLLRKITVVGQDGRTLPGDVRRWRNASLKFLLTDGTARLSRPAAVLTARQLRAAKRFFGLTDRG